MSTVAAETTAPKAQAEQSGFVKAMTLTDATMLVAGSMIGSGIFIVSADIARSLPSPFWLLVAWLVTGVMTLLGALAYGELAVITCSCVSRWVLSWVSSMGGPFFWSSRREPSPLSPSRSAAFLAF